MAPKFRPRSRPALGEMRFNFLVRDGRAQIIQDLLHLGSKSGVVRRGIDGRAEVVEHGGGALLPVSVDAGLYQCVCDHCGLQVRGNGVIVIQ
jgi:hypothetical protein